MAADAVKGVDHLRFELHLQHPALVYGRLLNRRVPQLRERDDGFRHTLQRRAGCSPLGLTRLNF